VKLDFSQETNAALGGNILEMVIGNLNNSYDSYAHIDEGSE